MRGVRRRSIRGGWRAGDPLAAERHDGGAHRRAVAAKELLSSAFGLACQEPGIAQEQRK